MTARIRALLLALGLACAPALAQERLEMEGTAIIGNKELPKILYIVPWKSAETIAMDAPEYDSVLDQALRPIDRDSFRRRVNYYRHLYPETNGSASQ